MSARRGRLGLGMVDGLEGVYLRARVGERVDQSSGGK